MKKINKKYLAMSILACGAAVMPLANHAAYATEDETVPVYLTAAASPIDVTIGTSGEVETDDVSGKDFVDLNGNGIWDEGEPEAATGAGATAIYMQVAEDSNVATVTDLLVKNNSVASPVYVNEISLTNISSGYTNAPFSDDYSLKAANSKAFGLAITGVNSTPLSTAADLRVGYAPSTADTIDAEETTTYNLAGKVSVITEAVTNAKIADCVITLSQTIGE